MPPLHHPEELQHIQNLGFYNLAVPYLTSHTPKLLYQKKSFVHLTPIDIFVVFLEYIILHKKQSCKVPTLFPINKRQIFNLQELIRFLESYTKKYQYPNAIQRTSPTNFKDFPYSQNEVQKCQIYNQNQMLNYMIEAFQYYDDRLNNKVKEELVLKSKNIFYEIYYQNDLSFINDLDQQFIKKIQFFEENFNFKDWLDKVLTYIKKFIFGEQIDKAQEYLQFIDINVKKDHRDIFFENFKQNKSYLEFQQEIDTSHMIDFKNSKKVKKSIEKYLKKALENVQLPHEKIIKEIMNQINKELKKDEKIMYGKMKRLPMRFFSYLVGKFMQRCYEKILVDKTFLDFIKNYNNKLNGPIIFIPTHQSYFDFLVVSYICLSHYYQVPFIAAGSNLNNIIGVGKILKNSSAFFIKRTGLRFPEIYRAFLQVYIDTLLQAKFDLEFFIEGTRSRTGKVLPPKYGILKYVYLSFLNKNIKDCTLLPISVNYEHVMEIGSIENEWFGKDKSKESFMGLIKSISALNLNFKNVQIKMGQPLQLSKYPKDLNSIDNTLHKLANSITQELEQNTIIMNTSLISILFLVKRKYSYHQFFPLLNVLKNSIKQLGGLLNRDSQDHSVQESIKEQNYIYDNQQEEYYELTDYKNLKFIFRMLYYKNTTFFLFAKQALICLVIFAKQRQDQDNIQQDEVINQVLYLQNLFQNESYSFMKEKREEIKYILQQNVLQLFYKDSQIQLADQSNEKQFIIDILLSYIAPIIDNYRETFLQVCQLLENNDTHILFDEFKSQIFKKLQQQFLQESIESGESCSITYIQNAITKLLNLGLVQKKKTLNEKQNKFQTILILLPEKENEIRILMNNLQFYSKTLNYENYKL